LKEIVLIVGGCRSGKSRHALEMAEERGGKTNVFMATCIPHDEEMRQRVARHKAERSPLWKTEEVPLALPKAIRHWSKRCDVILVDCLTLWTSNLLMESDEPEGIEMEIQQLALALEGSRCPVVLVSNEVGCGIVPENPLARQFRDFSGFCNQAVAAVADRVVWMVAGIPVAVKPGP